MVKRIHVLAAVVALLVLGVLFAVDSARVHADYPPAAHSRSIEIQRQIDAVRYVETAIVRNNRHGDWILEFMAERTDLPDTHEWWMVMFENDPAFEHAIYLEIDDTWIYSGGIFMDGESLKASLSVPGDQAVIDVIDPCMSSEILAFRQILEQIAEHREVVTSVVADVVGELAGSDESDDCVPDWDAWSECDAGCGPLPGEEEACVEIEDCNEQLACCVERSAVWKCVDDCICNHLCPEIGKAKCLQNSKASQTHNNHICVQNFLNCTGQCP